MSGAAIAYAVTTTETTDAGGFLADITVPGTWDIMGALAQEQTGVAELVKVNQEPGRKFTLRAFTRDTDGTLRVLGHTQVRVLFAALDAG